MCKTASEGQRKHVLSVSLSYCRCCNTSHKYGISFMIDVNELRCLDVCELTPRRIYVHALGTMTEGKMKESPLFLGEVYLEHAYSGFQGETIEQGDYMLLYSSELLFLFPKISTSIQDTTAIIDSSPKGYTSTLV